MSSWLHTHLQEGVEHGGAASEREEFFLELIELPQDLLRLHQSLRHLRNTSQPHTHVHVRHSK